MAKRYCWALLACLFACDSVETPPLVIATEAEVTDEFVLELIQEHVRAAEANLGDAELRGTLGLVYEANGMWAWAARSFANAAVLDPENPRWGYHAATANFRAGKSTLGDELVASVAQRFSNFAPARFRYGITLMDLGDVESALVQFQACTKLRPEFAEGWVSMAEALVLLDHSEEALKYMTNLVKSQPDFARAKYVRGMALRDLGRTKEAERDLALGVGATRVLMPDNLVQRRLKYATGFQAMLSQSMKLIDSGQFSSGLALAQKALARQPDNVLLLNAQAIAYRSLKQPKRAIEAMSRARELEPGHFGTLTILSAARFDVRDYGLSLEAADAAALVAPNAGLAHFLRGRALLAMARMPEAAQALRLSIQLDPSRSSAYLYLAESLSAQARYEEAEPIWKEAVSRKPGNLPALFNLGMAQVSLLKVADAQETLELLRGLNLSDPWSVDVEQNLAAAISKLTGE